MLCDRVCILREGNVVVAGKISELLHADARRSEVTIIDADGKVVVTETEGDDAVRALLAKAIAEGARIESVVPKRETLEEIFVRRAI
jgi:ABC-2 type transport system ATP-binding protein